MDVVGRNVRDELLDGPVHPELDQLKECVDSRDLLRRPVWVTRRVTGSVGSSDSVSPDGSLSNLRVLVFHSAIFSSRVHTRQSTSCVSNQWFIGLRRTDWASCYDGGEPRLACRQTYDLPSGSNLKHAPHGEGASVLSFFLKIGATAIPAR